MSAPPPTHHRDLVVIGTSAGGVSALPLLAHGLPAGLPASVLVVQHLPVSSPRHLVALIQRETCLPVRWAEDGDPLRTGEIAVAPPGSHLLVDGDRMILSDGPRENYARPSINRLFRSAAVQRGSGVIGVLLTGTMDDGVAGLDAIKVCGGTAIVQDPDTAEYAELPRNAVRSVAVDRILPLSAIADAIAQLAGVEVPFGSLPPELAQHARLDRVARAEPAQLDELGVRDTARCPDCGGPLWRLRGLYRCFLGHAMSERVLLDAQVGTAEAAMWNALLSLEEHARLLDDRSASARDRGDLAAAAELARAGAATLERASRQRALIVELQGDDGR